MKKCTIFCMGMAIGAAAFKLWTMRPVKKLTEGEVNKILVAAIQEYLSDEFEVYPYVAAQKVVDIYALHKFYDKENLTKQVGKFQAELHSKLGKDRFDDIVFNIK